MPLSIEKIEKYRAKARLLKEKYKINVIKRKDFKILSPNHQKAYDFFFKKQGYHTAHFYGSKGTGKTTTTYNGLYDLMMENKDTNILYLKNAIKELKQIKRHFLTLGGKPKDVDSVTINKGIIDFGYFTTRGLNSKHGGNYDVVVIEEAMIASDLEELDRMAKMLLRGGHDFKLLVYIYNPDPHGLKNFDLLRMQKESELNIQFKPADNPILFNQKPKNYWDMLGEGLSEDAYKAWILGDLNIHSSEVIFNSDDMNYIDHQFNSPIMYIDPAVAEEYKNGSLSACVIVEEDRDKNIFILSYALENHIEGAKNKFIQLAKEHKVRKVYIETNQGGYSVKKAVKDEMKKQELIASLVGIHNSEDKHQRILSINLFDKRKLFFDKQTNNTAHNQILRYNYKNPHLNNDALDALAGGLKNLRKIGFSYTDL